MHYGVVVAVELEREAVLPAAAHLWRDIRHRAVVLDLAASWV